MENFSIKVGRSSSLNGSLLASMNQKEALAHFKKSRFSEEQIKKAHAEAMAQAKAMDKTSKSEPEKVEGE